MARDEKLCTDALRRVDAVESALRRMGVWSDTPPPPEAMDVRQAFGGDKLTFFQWLQFVLVPRVRAIAAGDGEFPRGSDVAAYAVRELDGHRGAEGLHAALREFDALFDGTDEWIAIETDGAQRRGRM